jgi:hypothetical protein
VWGLWLWLQSFGVVAMGLLIGVLGRFWSFLVGLEEHKGINNLCFDKACKINDLCVFIFVIFFEHFKHVFKLEFS